ncbi:hypothetical protein [Dactylosporangium sp. CA-139066]
MDAVAAQRYAATLQRRETARGGVEHGKRWLSALTNALLLETAA